MIPNEENKTPRDYGWVDEHLEAEGVRIQRERGMIT